MVLFYRTISGIYELILGHFFKECNLVQYKQPCIRKSEKNGLIVCYIVVKLEKRLRFLTGFQKLFVLRVLH